MSTRSRPSNRFRATAHLATLLLVLTTAGCFEVKRTSGLQPRASQLFLAEGTAEAGQPLVLSADPDGPHPGVRLEIPADAAPADTVVQLRVRFGDPRLPSIVQQFDLLPLDLELSEPALLSLEYSIGYEQSAVRTFAASGIQVWGHRGDPVADAQLQELVARDVEQRRLEARIDGFGSFYALHPQLRTLALQPARLVDPSVPLAASLVDGLLTSTPNGPLQVQVGQGSLADFRMSDAGDNLLVVHGTLGSAVVLGNSASLAPATPEHGFNPYFRNVVAFEYASSRSIAEQGNLLYDALRAVAGPTFGCRIVAHGTGGLVVRHALERAHLDPDRPGHQAGDPPLSDLVDRAVLIATPSGGVDLQNSAYGELLAAAGDLDTDFVQGLFDLVPNSGLLRNLASVAPPDDLAYHLIAGDASSAGNDGFVTVASALDELAYEPHQLFSGPLYDHIGLLAFADRTGVVLQARDWLADEPGTPRPLVGSLQVATARGADGYHTLRFTLTQAAAASSFVVVEYALGASPFRRATPAPGGRAVPILPGAPAPGATHSFIWDADADVPNLLRNLPVIVRVTPADLLGPGVPAQSGRLLLDPAD